MDEQRNDLPDFSDPATREQWLEFLRKASKYNGEHTKLEANGTYSVYNWKNGECRIDRMLGPLPKKPHDTEGE